MVKPEKLKKVLKKNIRKLWKISNELYDEGLPGSGSQVERVRMFLVDTLAQIEADNE